MGPSNRHAKLSRLSLLCLVATTTCTVPLHFTATATATATALLLRQEDAVCGGLSGLVQCGNDLPSEFCCPKDTACKRLASSDAVSVICCPKGSDCAFIQTVTCDIGQFDANLHPDNQIHLSNSTNVSLPKCADKCCPIGYKCNGPGLCTIDKESNKSPSSSAPSLPPPSPTSAPSASETTKTPPVVQTEQGFDGKSFAAGFFPGIVIGALGTIGLLWVIKKRRESQDKNRYSGDFGHVSRMISDPIYDPAYAARTDFIRRGSNSAQHSPNSMTGMVRLHGTGGAMTPKLKSLWDRTPKLGFGGFSGLPSNPAPPPPAVRAGNHNRDPYKTPTRTPRRSNTTSGSLSRSSSFAAAPKQQNSNKATTQQPRPLTTRSTSSETIDVLMRPPDFLAPPKALGMRENRFTQDSANTTFTKLMERAGYEESSRDDVRNWGRSPGLAR